uniref:excalibur calcium-binding domain-containing protein n=1 Tax=Sphingomonas bacterium TaxID=1895847 RepID=UPI00345B6C6B
MAIHAGPAGCLRLGRCPARRAYSGRTHRAFSLLSALRRGTGGGRRADLSRRAGYREGLDRDRDGVACEPQAVP